MSARYNAVIVGQTGVGKSTLINYLYGEKVAEAGVGKPVTKNGFHPINFEINGLSVCLFDSWGLEVGKHEQWLDDLDKEFKQRGVNESADKWFHSVFYCINAGGARIQDCDITIIKKFIAEKYKISVVLTKCDQVSEEVEEALKKELQKQINGLSVISVCSEEKKTRTGISEPFGKKDIERQAFDDFFDSLILRLPLRCKWVMEEALESWIKESKIKTKKDVGLAGWRQSEVESELTHSAKRFHKEIHELVSSEIKQTFQMYGSFATRLDYPPSELNNSIVTDSYFKPNVTTGDFEWWILLLLPIVISWGLYFGKDNAVEEIEKYIDKCEKEFKNIIDKQIEGVTDMLQSLKLKVTEQTSLKLR